jgi:hypothetical protein
MAVESQKAARQLSTRLLHLQDEERRKFSRELHDSLGQYLAAAKMSLDALAHKHGEDELLDGARAHLEQSMAETRTISYLLHPPLLDETGLGLAARWYLDGFSQRSGIQVRSEIPEEFPRMAHDVELALFRVLQECLTNIHRHSKSNRADVTLRWMPGEAYLRVRDYGGGIAAEVLRQFRESGSNVGVGLAGMRERVRDQGGNLRCYRGGDHAIGGRAREFCCARRTWRPLICALEPRTINKIDYCRHHCSRRAVYAVGSGCALFRCAQTRRSHFGHFFLRAWSGRPLLRLSIILGAHAGVLRSVRDGSAVVADDKTLE